MKPATSHLACSYGLPRPIIKSDQKKKWVWTWARGAPKICGFPFNISVMAEASDFKIGMRLGFAKAHHKIPHRRKSGCGHRVEELPKILRFPFNICAMAEASNFKFGLQLGFAEVHHKITPRGKSGRGLGLGKFPKSWCFISYFCNGWAVLLALTELLVYLCCLFWTLCESFVCKKNVPLVAKRIISYDSFVCPFESVTAWHTSTFPTPYLYCCVSCTVIHTGRCHAC